MSKQLGVVAYCLFWGIPNPLGIKTLWDFKKQRNQQDRIDANIQDGQAVNISR